MDGLNVRIGKSIRDIRSKKVGITQEEFANRVGVSRPSIANIERGQQQITIVQLYAIAEALGESVYSILDVSMPNTESTPEVSSRDDVPPAIMQWVNSARTAT